jgi:hypothetical protein
MIRLRPMSPLSRRRSCVRPTRLEGAVHVLGETGSPPAEGLRVSGPPAPGTRNSGWAIWRGSRGRRL